MRWGKGDADGIGGGWTLFYDDGNDVAHLFDDEAATFPPLVKAERRIAVLEEALRQACADGWADGDGAMAGYLRDAEAQIEKGEG